MNHLLNPTEHVVDLYLGLLQYLQQAEGRNLMRFHYLEKQKKRKKNIDIQIPGGILEGAIVGN